jgi:5'-3' exonuclease
VAADDPDVERALVCTPDKDLAQCVRDPVVAQVDRRKNVVYDEAGVVARFGVAPESIPDYLALVGDSADGFPGLPGWGSKSAAAVLRRYRHLADVPADGAQWDVDVRGAAKLASTLVVAREAADLFLVLATLRLDAPVGAVADWRWAGPSDDLADFAARLGAPALHTRAVRLAERVG